jgi:hypothetical protein
MRPETSIPEFYKNLKLETAEKLPVFTDTKLFKDGAEYSGLWTAGHYQFRHKSLPPPIAPIRAPAPPVSKAKPVRCGVWDGRKFVPTRPFDIMSVPRDQRLQFINEAFAIGNDVRYCVNDVEIGESELRSEQPYSIYPRKFARPTDISASTKEKTLPLRTEGPMIRVQWVLLSDKGQSLLMPSSAIVPEEISLAQLWHRHIANRYKQQISEIKWGKHYRAGSEFETGQVSDLQDNDSVEIIIFLESAPTGQLEVLYTLGDETVVNRLNVKNTATIAEVRDRISRMHKAKPIQSLMFEGATIAEEDSYSDWMLRSGGVPRQIVAKIVPLVQVNLDYMGVIKQMNVRLGTPKDEFLVQTKAFLGTSHNRDAIPLGLDDWEIRTNFTYDIREPVS